MSQLVFIQLTYTPPSNPTEANTLRQIVTQDVCSFLNLTDCSGIVFVGFGGSTTSKKRSQSFGVTLSITGTNAGSNTSSDYAQSIQNDLKSSNSVLKSGNLGQYNPSGVQVQSAVQNFILDFTVFDGDFVNSTLIQVANSTVSDIKVLFLFSFFFFLN